MAKKSNESPIRLAESRALENLDGERKTVTALFADIKGSMELMEDLDPEEARAIVDPALKLMIDAVHRYDGYIVQSTGDGIFALFGAPVAHEDHPQRALYAALRMQEELRRYSAGCARRQPADRGAHRGEHRRSRGAFDPDWRGAYRVHADRPHDQPGGADAGARADRFDRDQRTDAQARRRIFQASSRSGPPGSKGVSEPVNVYEVTGLGPLRTRLQRRRGAGCRSSSGREQRWTRSSAPLEQRAKRTWADRRRDGRAGVGKSRLFFEFKAERAIRLPGAGGISVSHGKASAYLPVIDLLTSYFEIARETTMRASGAKRSAARCSTLDRVAGRHPAIPVRAARNLERRERSAGADGRADPRRRTLEAIKRILLRESLNQPLIVIFEDLHWIDGETQALLNLLVDSIGTRDILLLVNYRPEYRINGAARPTTPSSGSIRSARRAPRRC